MCNALNEMKQKSMIEGRAEGGNLMIYSLVQDLLLTPEVGSKRLGITVEELKNRMILCGYNSRKNNAIRKTNVTMLKWKVCRLAGLFFYLIIFGILSLKQNKVYERMKK